jgi:RNA polymerase sigma factor (sigma-70 family)
VAVVVGRRLDGAAEMSSHRDDARAGAIAPVLVPGLPADASSSAPQKPPEPSPKPSLVVIRGGPRLTPEQEALVLQSGPLVSWAIKKRFRGAGSDLQRDLRQACAADITFAARNYDPSRGRFIHYVLPFIFGAIDDYRNSEGFQAALSRGGRLAGRQWNAEHSRWVHWSEVDQSTPEANEKEAVEMASRFVATLVTGEAYDYGDAEDDQAASVDRRRAIEVVKAAMARMPKTQRSVWTLRFVYQRTVMETAAELGIAERSVKRHVSNGMDVVMAELAIAGITELP